MKMLKNLFFDIYYHRDYVAYARKLGAQVGNECRILCNPRKCFDSEPWLIKIGNHVEITGGVKLLTHDGSTWIIRKDYPDNVLWGTIEIGDNTFIGYGSVVMPNVKIGSNCIVGAGAIVTKNVPDNSVVAGVPARIINDYSSIREKMIRNSIPILNMSISDRISYSRNHFKDFFDK